LLAREFVSRKGFSMFNKRGDKTQTAVAKSARCSAQRQYLFVNLLPDGKPSHWEILTGENRSRWMTQSRPVPFLRDALPQPTSIGELLLGIHAVIAERSTL